MTGPAITQKAKQMAEWVFDVRYTLRAMYEEYLIKNGEMVTESHSEKLDTSIAALLVQSAIFQRMATAYFEGKKPEEFVDHMYRHWNGPIYKAAGMGAMFKRARQASNAAYAASPESEAYWAS